jgi:uncharacterized membrane protein YkvA (DUF1232 family)
MLSKLRAWAQQLKSNLSLLAVAACDPRVPWQAKWIAALTVAYALSPIDLIPDFIPVIGLLDDLILLPLGIWAALKLIPPALLTDLRARATAPLQQAKSKVAAGVIIGIWLASAWFIARWMYSR